MPAAVHVVLFYRYVYIQEPAALAEKQRALCADLQLKGRLRIASEGINGTLAGSPATLSAYRSALSHDDVLGSGSIHWKLSEASCSPDEVFPQGLEVKMVNEITATGNMSTSLPAALGGHGGQHVSPEEFHRALQDSSTVVIDVRNHYETALGTFEGAIDPKLRSFAQLPVWVEANRESLEGQNVVLYCTGGIRCEKASAYLNGLGVAKSVSQLEGGIHAYLAAYAGGDTTWVERDAAMKTAASGTSKDTCLFRGVNFQFDGRMELAGDGSRLTRCAHCGSSRAGYRERSERGNIEDKTETMCSVCRDLVPLCAACSDENSTGTVLCAEHMLLGDRWNEFLSRVGNKEGGVLCIRRCVGDLRFLLDASVSKAKRSRGGARGQRKRQRCLGLQLQRLQEWLDAHPSNVQTVQSRDRTQKFVGLTPMLNWHQQLCK